MEFLKKKLFPLFLLIAYRLDENRAENVLETFRNERLLKMLALIKLGGKSLAKSPFLIREL